MNDFLSSLQPILELLELLGLLALAGFNLCYYFWVALGMSAMLVLAAGNKIRRWAFIGMLSGMVVSLCLQVASVWYMCVGKLGLALVLGGLVLPAMPLVPLLVDLVEDLLLSLFHLAKGLVFLAKNLPKAAVHFANGTVWLAKASAGFLSWLWLRIRGRLDGLANHGKPDKVSPQPTLPSMNPILPPTNPSACDALVSEAECLQQGSMANEQLIQDTLFAAYAAAGAKRGAQIPQETMIEPHLLKEPQGVRGRMTWQEIWVFQTVPKTAVRITFTEDGKGGADYAIQMN